MNKVASLILLVIIQFLVVPVFAFEFEFSARSHISDNPFLAYGYNPKTKVLTGYLVALRTAPGRTDECKLVFKGNAKRLSVKYLEETWAHGNENQSDGGVYIREEKKEPYLRFSKKSLGGDCDWILPFKIGPRISETAEEVSVAMKVSNIGSWVGVYIISAKRAKFHDHPDAASVRKAYLVEGDLIYVYDEQADWFFVQYEKGKNKTVGWIRKADTVQP